MDSGGADARTGAAPSGCDLSPKHRLAVLLMYSSGVRMREHVALAIGGADADQMVLRVRDGKVRLTIFSERLLPALRRQAAGRSRLAPLFPGSLSIRPLQNAAQRARQVSGLPRGVSATAFAMRSRRICWKRVRIYASFRTCLGTVMSRRRRATRTSRVRAVVASRDRCEPGSCVESPALSDQQC